MNDKEKLINTLRSEASRLGYYGLAIEDFIKKCIDLKPLELCCPLAHFH